MVEKEEEKKGDQEGMGAMNWESQSCKVFVMILVCFAILLLGVAIIVRLIRFGSEKNPFFFIFTFYLALFIGLLVISIIKWERVLMYFTFLTTRKGVGMFMIFVGSLLFDWNEIFEMAVSVLLILIGILYIIYGFKVGEEQRPDPTKAGKDDKKKEDNKKDEERKKQYEENKGVAVDANKQNANQNAAPPSYQPKGGEVKYQQDPGINRPDAAPRVASNAPPPPAVIRFDDEPDYENQAPAYNQRAREPVRQQTPPNYAHDNSDEEEESPGAYAYNPGSNAAPQSYNQHQDPYKQRVASQEDERKYYAPPPPDETPVQVPAKLKKFKDINDLLF